MAVTDVGGSVIERTHFSAYEVRQGGQWLGSGIQTTERGFTNHEQVDDLETTHMNARVHDPWGGRFLQPDPLVQDVYRPQNWNPYAYAWNNPLRFTDPTGIFNVGRALRTIASIAITIWMPYLKRSATARGVVQPSRIRNMQLKATVMRSPSPRKGRT